MTEAPGDQTAMPAHQRIGGDERGDGVERPSPEEPSLRRQSTTLIVSQPKLPATKLLFEDPVLLDQVGDNVLLMPMHPARNRQQEQLERESSGRHSAIVGALNSHAHRQLRTDPFFCTGRYRPKSREMDANASLSRLPHPWTSDGLSRYCPFAEFSSVAGVDAPAFVERPRRTSHGPTEPCVAGVDAPAFVERCWGRQASSCCRRV